jgi:hypothetical protein
MSLRCWLGPHLEGQKGRLEGAGKPVSVTWPGESVRVISATEAELTSGRVPLPDVEKAITIDSYVSEPSVSLRRTITG